MQLILNIMKKDPLVSSLMGTFYSLPVPVNITFFWNFGSLLFFFLASQIFTGLWLAYFYFPDVNTSFDNMFKSMEFIDLNWMFRCFHANGASFVFICIYLHVARGVYYSSYMYKHTWGVGVVLLLMMMGTAFLGYSLPWNQMSYWAVTVITNLLSVVPFVGVDLLKVIWGGYSVDHFTLIRFFAFHYLLPFIVLALSVIHVVYLHTTGSNNLLGLKVSVDKFNFSPYYLKKDGLGVFFKLFFFFLFTIFNPYLMWDAENFIAMNMMVTPQHIQPEWYFLFAYAILRSIPSKLGGVIALAMAVIILLSLSYTHIGYFKQQYMYVVTKFLFWFFVMNVLLLTWIGARPAEDPYIFLSQVFTITYFSFYALYPLVKGASDKFILGSYF